MFTRIGNKCTLLYPGGKLGMGGSKIEEDSWDFIGPKEEEASLLYFVCEFTEQMNAEILCSQKKTHIS